MSDVTGRIVATAKALILAAGTFHAVASADIKSQADAITKSYPSYTANQIANKISDEIKKTHSPGVSGSI